MRTCGKSGFRLPAKDRLNLTASLSSSSIPKSYKSALLDPNWAASMKDEYDALIQNNTWQLVPRPSNTNIVSCKWVFRHKLILMEVLHIIKLDGYVVVTLSNTTSIMIRLPLQLTQIHTVLSIAVSSSWPIHELDVENTFLHGSFQETIYC
jgi:hypothetical protein